MNILLDFLIKINNQNSNQVIQGLRVCVWAIIILGGLTKNALADLTITPTTNSTTIGTQLTGENVTISNVTINQGTVGNQTGVFSGGNTGTAGPLLGIANGVVLVTGDVTSADGPNKSTSLSTGGEAGPNNPLLTTIDTGTQHDTVTLQFNVVPSGNTLSLDYVFASEEYNEYVCTQFNDAVGIFVSGPGITGDVNIAKIDQNSANFSINQINRGAAGHISSTTTGCDLTNSQFFVNNIDNYDEVNSANAATSATIQSNYSNVEYDGLTKPLAATLGVQPNQTYTIKVVTADIGDAQWDGAVFLDLVQSYNLDYGDAPDSYKTTGVNQAVQLPGAARHSADTNPLVYLGSVPPDVEDNGTPATSPNDASGDDSTGDDEDAFSSFLTLAPGITSHTISNISVHNASSRTAKLMGWIDFNQDGDFLDTGEQATVDVAPNQTTANLNWSSFTSTNVGTTYARFRITTDPNLINSPSSAGLANDGEVEDYKVEIAKYDYGDAPDAGGGTGVGNYQTTSSDVGAAQVILNDARQVLSLGNNVDYDNGTLQNNTAAADDNNGIPDDEDGVSNFPTLTAASNQTYTVPVSLKNSAAKDAFLVGYIDFNQDGDFNDAGEKSTTVTVPSSTTNPRTFNVTFTTPAGITVGDTFARFRLGQIQATAELPTGASSATDYGEIEDYSLAIASPISPLAGQLVINEVLYAQTGSSNSAADNDEFIEIFNPSVSPINLSGFKLIDGNLLVSDTDGAGSINGSASPYVFPSGTSLQPGEYAVIWIGSNVAGRAATGAAFQTWLGKPPKLNNVGDDVWLYDANTQVIDYMVYGEAGTASNPGAINTRLDSSLNLWVSTYENTLDNIKPGQSISLTPNGVDGNSSGCWEKTAILNTDPDSAGVAGRCTGFLNTVDTDIVFISPDQRITSVGKNNNQLLQDYGDSPAGYEGNSSARHNLSTNLNLGTVFPDAETAPQSSANADGDDAVAVPQVDDEEGISSFPTLTTNTNSYSLTTKISNPSGLAVKVYAWIDFDRDQKFDQDERATVVNTSALTGNVTLNWNNIGTTGANIINGNTFVRVRLTTSNLNQTTETTQRDDASIGLAADGEMEDYPLAIAQAFDFGDAPDTYGTDKTAGNSSNASESVGASHAITSNLFLGTTRPDEDANGFVDGTDNNGNATDDDAPIGTGTGNGDDEDNFVLPTLIRGATSYIIPKSNIIVTNTATPAANATLHAWIDFNKNGKFDSTEYASIAVNSSTNGGNPIGNLTWTGINVGTTGNTYARFRLTSDGTINSNTPGGAANNGEVEDYQIAIASRPELLLVKRITALNPGQPGKEVQFSNFDDDSTVNDNSYLWPNPNVYLRGAIDAGKVKPDDVVEYTVYFLSGGDANAKDVKICDAIPDNMTFVKNTYGIELGIGLGFNSTVLPTSPNFNLSNLLNDDQGDFYEPGTAPPANLCKKVTPANTLVDVDGTNNDNGSVVVKIQDLPKANTSGSPTDSYGFIRFRAKVK